MNKLDLPQRQKGKTKKTKTYNNQDKTEKINRPAFVVRSKQILYLLYYSMLIYAQHLLTQR